MRKSVTSRVPGHAIGQCAIVAIAARPATAPSMTSAKYIRHDSANRPGTINTSGRAPFCCSGIAGGPSGNAKPAALKRTAAAGSGMFWSSPGPEPTPGHGPGTLMTPPLAGPFSPAAQDIRQDLNA